jgi:hypothetical protein
MRTEIEEQQRGASANLRRLARLRNGGNKENSLKQAEMADGENNTITEGNFNFILIIKFHDFANLGIQPPFNQRNVCVDESEAMICKRRLGFWRFRRTTVTAASPNAFRASSRFVAASS